MPLLRSRKDPLRTPFVHCLADGIGGGLVGQAAEGNPGRRAALGASVLGDWRGVGSYTSSPQALPFVREVTG